MVVLVVKADANLPVVVGAGACRLPGLLPGCPGVGVQRFAQGPVYATLLSLTRDLPAVLLLVRRARRSIALSQPASSLAFRPGRRRDGAGGSSESTRTKTSPGEPQKGTRPVSISYRTTPRL